MLMVGSVGCGGKAKTTGGTGASTGAMDTKSTK
jgi:hypothetical protein